MKRRCPNPNCIHPKKEDVSRPKFLPIIRKGSFYRRSDRRRIARYFCKNCETHFSSASHDQDYRQKRRELNQKIEELLCSNISQRRLSLVLKANRKTIARKFRLLSNRATLKHKEWLEAKKDQFVNVIQFDDLETSEHTKCKPLSVTLAVDEKTREIISFKVSKMPAKGHLSKIALAKYGFRKDERPKNWDWFFKDLKSVLPKNTYFKSDENPHYKLPLKRNFSESTHEAFLGGRGSVSGQGELKKLKFDTLFSLNHTCAMLRANLNRLNRKTWCTTKRIEGLIDHLNLYVSYHNRILVRH